MIHRGLSQTPTGLLLGTARMLLLLLLLTPKAGSLFAAQRLLLLQPAGAPLVRLQGLWQQQQAHGGVHALPALSEAAHPHMQ